MNEVLNEFDIEEDIDWREFPEPEDDDVPEKAIKGGHGRRQ